MQVMSQLQQKKVCSVKILTVLVLSWKGDTSNIRSSFILQVKQRGVKLKVGVNVNVNLNGILRGLKEG